MSRNDEWHEFTCNLLSCARQEHKSLPEYISRKKQQEQLDEMLGNSLTTDDKFIIEEMLFELGAAADLETELLYRQGWKDCVWLLKNLGVLA